MQTSCIASCIDPLLKRNEQNIWDTSRQYNKSHKTYPFPNTIEHDIFDEQKCAYKARVKHVRDDDEPSLATDMKLSDRPHFKEAIRVKFTSRVVKNEEFKRVDLKDIPRQVVGAKEIYNLIILLIGKRYQFQEMRVLLFS